MFDLQPLRHISTLPETLNNSGCSRHRDDSPKSSRTDYRFDDVAPAESILDCAIHQLLNQPTVVRVQRAGCLAHIDANELLLRVHPEIGSGIPTPGELPGRSHYASDAHTLPHREAESESVARIIGQQRSRCDASAEVIRGH